VFRVPKRKEIVNQLQVFLAGGPWPLGFFFAIFTLTKIRWFLYSEF